MQQIAVTLKIRCKIWISNVYISDYTTCVYMHQSVLNIIKHTDIGWNNALLQS